MGGGEMREVDWSEKAVRTEKGGGKRRRGSRENFLFRPASVGVNDIPKKKKSPPHRLFPSPPPHPPFEQDRPGGRGATHFSFSLLGIPGD